MYNIIVNPQGGKGKSVKALKIVEQKLTANNIAYKIYNTEYAGHATEIARELSKTPDTKIIMMGGDGSFNEILNGIENFENVTLGIIPCGTGNDFVRASGHPTDPKRAIELILKNNVGHVDFIDLGKRRCLNVAGAGMDVDVLIKYESMKCFRGKIKYYASLIYTLIHLKFHKLRVTVDGKSMDKTVFMIGVGNGTCIGGGMPISPHSKVDDGLLNVVIVNELPKRKIPLTLLKFLKGKHIDMPFTEEYTGKEVVVEVLDDGRIETDGEVIDDKILDCKIVSDTLKVFI